MPDFIITAELQHVCDLVLPFLIKIFTGCVDMEYVLYSEVEEHKGGIHSQVCEVIESGGGSGSRCLDQKARNRGVPQEGVLSPLLWNLDLNPMLLFLERGHRNMVA